MMNIIQASYLQQWKSTGSNANSLISHMLAGVSLAQIFTAVNEILYSVAIYWTRKGYARLMHFEKRCLTVSAIRCVY